MSSAHNLHLIKYENKVLQLSNRISAALLFGFILLNLSLILLWQPQNLVPAPTRFEPINMYLMEFKPVVAINEPQKKSVLTTEISDFKINLAEPKSTPSKLEIPPKLELKPNKAVVEKVKKTLPPKPKTVPKKSEPKKIEAKKVEKQIEQVVNTKLPSTQEAQSEISGRSQNYVQNSGSTIQTEPTKAQDSHILSLLIQEIERHKTYPRQARRSNAQGIATLLVKIDSNGKVSGWELSASSKNSILDNATKQLGEKLTGFETKLPGKAINILVPVRYSLQS